jgi:hypothetical protein
MSAFPWGKRRRTFQERLRRRHHLEAQQLEATRLKTLQNFTNESALDAIGLDLFYPLVRAL